MGRSQLKAALRAEKGIDVKKLKEKRRLKDRVKAKAKRTGSRGGAGKLPRDGAADENDEAEEDDDDDDDDDDTEGGALVAEAAEGGVPEDSDEEEADEPAIDLAALDESSDDSSVDFEEKIERPKKPKQTKSDAITPKTDASKKAVEAADEEEDDEDEDEGDNEADEEIDWADIPEEDREDLVPRTRLNINNTAGLLSTLKRFAIPTGDDDDDDDGTTTFASHQSLASQQPTADVIGEDLMDDVKRELAFYAQALDAARRGRALLRAEGVPFSRPADYFAEMVKDDGHMEKIKAKLVEEASAKKASAEARKLRDLKKFGKQVQVAKLQERQRAKRETLDKIKTLKRKRSETGGGDLGTHEADLFDVGVDNELDKYSNKNNKGSSQRGGERGGDGGRPGFKRQKKNEKFGFGGKKKHAKSGDAASSGDLSGFSARRMKGGVKGKTPKTARLGKSRRKAGAAKR